MDDGKKRAHQSTTKPPLKVLEDLYLEWRANKFSFKSEVQWQIVGTVLSAFELIAQFLS